MGQIRQSLKIIEKSEEEIDSLKSAVESLNLSDDEKETLIYGLYLIVWLPKLILEQAISMFRLKELLWFCRKNSRDVKIAIFLMDIAQ